MLPAAPVVGMRPAASGAPRCPMPRSMLRRPLPMRSCLWPSALRALPMPTVPAETVLTASAAPVPAPHATPASRRSPARPMVPAPLSAAVRIRTTLAQTRPPANHVATTAPATAPGPAARLATARSVPRPRAVPTNRRSRPRRPATVPGPVRLPRHRTAEPSNVQRRGV